MKTITLTILFLICLFSSSNLFSQEIQVAILPENDLMKFDKELEKKLGIFSEYPDFVEAQLFKTNDSAFFLEISYIQKGNLIRTKKMLNQIELQEFRNKILSEIKTKAPQINYDQSGRSKFLAGTTFLSLGYYGWSLPYLIDAKGGVAVGLYLITSGAGFFIPYLATKETQLTSGMANLSIGGGTLGLAHGFLLWDIFDIGDYRHSVNLKTLNIMMTATSIAELLTGYHYAKNNMVSEGRANSMVFSSYIGGIYSGCLAYIIVGDDPAESMYITLPMLAGSIGGAVFGNYVANQQNMAPGDPLVVMNAGVVGLLLGSTIMNYVKPTNDNIAIGTLVASSALGLYVGNSLIKGYDFSNSTASYISLGTLGGGLIGGGLAAIIVDKMDYRSAEKVAYTLVSLGAALGYGLTYNSLKDKEKITNKEKTSQLDWNINPVGFFANNFNKNYGQSIPFFNLSIKF